MEFREVAAALQGATLETHSMDLGRSQVQLAVPSHTVIFDGIISMKWVSSQAGPAVLTLSTVGLERLGPGEPWRLYIRTPDGTELELSCRAVSCDGEEVTGVGRSYRH